MNAFLLGASLVSLLGGPSSGHWMEDRELGFVEIREPGNPADENGYGSVAYAYRITRERITNEHYARFLNAVDGEGVNSRALFNPQMGESALGGILFDPRGKSGKKYAVKPGFAGRPVVFVNWRDAARFANWMHNGGGRGSSTEVGTYNLRAAARPDRTRRGRYWIPGENEIYKAGFYLPLARNAIAGEALYWREGEAAEPSDTEGAIAIRLREGRVDELVDPFLEPPGAETAGLEFAGRKDPEAETGLVGFRLAAGLSAEPVDEPGAEGEIYAGSPEAPLVLPAFFGSGAGGGNPPAQGLPPAPPPAS